jgi:pimeloyl-ACP methyl ester carboxylesterase
VTAPFTREWGAGQPVVALAPLGLESSAFAGVGELLSRRGFRTIAVDLPGFGRTPLPDEPLTPAVLAAPVIALARTLDPPPILLGVSLGGRVALEVALTAPEACRAVIPVAPYLPWRRYRTWLDWAAWLDPRMADWLPLEAAWPALRWLAAFLERTPWVRDDALAQAGARLVYYLACPATRAAFISAARELALDPAFGAHGLWTRLGRLRVPSTFIWCERDQLVSLRFSGPATRTCPQAAQALLPCAGHWLNGPHHRCLAMAVADIAPRLLSGDEERPRTRHTSGVDFEVHPCLATAAGVAPGAVPVSAEGASHA